MPVLYRQFTSIKMWWNVGEDRNPKGTVTKTDNLILRVGVKLESGHEKLNNASFSCKKVWITVHVKMLQKWKNIAQLLMRCSVLVEPLDGSVSVTLSGNCVMGCSAAMATGVSQVLQVDFLSSEPSCQISSVKCSLYCENCWKRGWKSDRERVSGRLCRPQEQRDSIIWSAWVGEGCAPVSFQRETLCLRQGGV